MKKQTGKDKAGFRKGRRSRREWCKELVRKELVALHEKGHEMREKEIRGMDGELVAAAYRYYGGWVKALAAAGIRPCYIPRTRWTEELVLRELSRMMERGESMKAVDVNRNNQKLYRAAGELFGSYIEAVESLGVDYADIGQARRWSEEQIKTEIKRLFKKRKPMNTGWMRKNENALYLAAQKKYGSWERALGAVGIKDYGKIRKRGKWSAEIVRDRIREMYKAGDRLDAAYVMGKDRKLLYAGKRYFGGWEKAVSTAGIDYGRVRVDRRKKWNRKMIIEKILEMKKRGEKLNHGAAAESDRNLVAAAIRHFGSWRAAVSAAGIDYMKVCVCLNWTEDDVIVEIRKLESDEADLISSVMCRVNEPLFSAGVSRFDSWEKAVRAAGIDYDKYRKIRRWSKEKVIVALQERMKGGGNVAFNAVKKDDGGLCSAVFGYFSSWDEAVVASREDMDFKDALSRIDVGTGKREKQISRREIFSARRA